MKTFSLILLVVGIIMIIIDGINIPVKKKVIEVGPIEINRTENKHIGWPSYAAGVLVAVGVIGLVATRKKA